MIGVVVRPFAYVVLYVLVLAPLISVLYAIVPEGRLKVILFKVRSGPEATRHDKRVMLLGVAGAYLLLICEFAWLASGSIP